MKPLVLGDLLKRDAALAAQPVKSVVGIPVDEMGQSLTRTERPLLGPMFFGPRVFDRRSSVWGSWSADQIINAIAALDNGDMGPTADLGAWMSERDAAYLGFRQTRILTPAGLSWSWEPADDSALAKEIAAFVTAETKAIPNFQHAYRDAYDAIGSGISALWVDWQEGGRKFKGGKPKSKYRIDGIHHINPKRYRFHWLEEKFLILPDWAFSRAQDLGLMNPSYGPTQFSQIANAGLGIEPPPWKCIIHRTRTKSGHPAKAGLIPVSAMHVYFRLKATIDLSVYSEVYGMPGRVGKYPPGASDEDQAKLQFAMDRIGTDMSAIVSKDVDISWLESKSRTGGGLPFIDLLKESERQLQLAWLGQDQTNTHNPTGGRTQVAEGGAPIRQDLVEADCIDAQTTWTMQLGKPIVGFSDYGWELAETLCPKFKIHYEQEEDYVAMSEVDVNLITKAGLKQTQGQLATRYRRDLPDGVDPKEIVTPPAVPSPFGQPGVPDVAPVKKPATKPPLRIAASSTNFATETETTAHEYATTQINITGSVRSSVLDLGATIPDDALADDGREDNPHVTVKYGIDPSVTIDEIRAVVGPRATGSLIFGSTAFFAGPDADVVFVTVDSPDLVALNKAVTGAVETTNTQPNYVPHLTLAYVESGRGHEFAGNGALNGVKFDYNAVHFYDANRQATKIQAIRGHVRVRPVTPKMSDTFYEPRFWKGEDVPGGWPEGFEVESDRAFGLTLSNMIATEPDRDRRIGMERDREMMRRDAWAKFNASNAKPSSTQSAIDDLTAKTMRRAEAAFASLAKDVRDVIEQAERDGKKIEDIPDLLRAAFPKMDSKRLARLSARTVFVAGLHGRVTAKRTVPN